MKKAKLTAAQIAALESAGKDAKALQEQIKKERDKFTKQFGSPSS